MYENSIRINYEYTFRLQKHFKFQLKIYVQFALTTEKGFKKKMISVCLNLISIVRTLFLPV